MMRKHRLRVGIAVAVLAACSLYIADGSGWLIFIPSTHDARLVGEWKATWAWTVSPRERKMTFLSDGTGNVEGWRFLWGTRNATLYVKRRSAGEGWDSGSATYSVKPGAKSVWFEGKPSATIPTEMHR
jgi:hypothetical protein